MLEFAFNTYRDDSSILVYNQICLKDIASAQSDKHLVQYNNKIDGWEIFDPVLKPHKMLFMLMIAS